MTAAVGCLQKHTAVTAIANVYVANAIHRDLLGACQAAGKNALGIATAGERLHQHPVVAGVDDVDVAAAIHRHAPGTIQAAVRNHALYEAAAGGRLLQYLVVSGVGNVDVAAVIHRHAKRTVQAAADGYAIAPCRAAGVSDRHLDHALIGIGYVHVPRAVHGDAAAGPAPDAAAERALHVAAS